MFHGFHDLDDILRLVIILNDLKWIYTIDFLKNSCSYAYIYREFTVGLYRSIMMYKAIDLYSILFDLICSLILNDL